MPANTSNTAELLPLYPLSDGEKLLILVHRSKALTGQSATDLSVKTGYTRTYIPKLYYVPKFNRKQIALVSTALQVPDEVFTENLEERLARLEEEVARLTEENKDINGRVKVLEAENNGLRKALMN